MSERPVLGHEDPLPILLDGEAVYSMLLPIGWRHFGYGKDLFDKWFTRYMEEGARAAGFNAFGAIDDRP